MKKLIFVASGFIMFLFLFSCGGSGSKSGSDSANETAVTETVTTEAVAPSVKKYGIKSGIVTFEHSGFGLKRKQVLYFDDYGAREAEEEYDENNNIEKTKVCDGKNRYTLVHKDKAAYKEGECYRGIAYKFDWEEAVKGGEEYKPTKLPNISVAGKDCESFSLTVSGTKSLYAGWNNICLMLETETMGEKVSYKAVAFEENATIPADKLIVPADFKVN